MVVVVVVVVELDRLNVRAPLGRERRKGVPMYNRTAGFQDKSNHQKKKCNSTALNYTVCNQFLTQSFDILKATKTTPKIRYPSRAITNTIPQRKPS